MALEVIGVGFGRTGTLSLKEALEQLGIGHCYHMMEVFSNPGHSPKWQALAAGEQIDIQELLEGYRAVVDWPTTYFWRELTTLYPAAKVILTVRNPDDWYRSVTNTIAQALGVVPPEEPGPVREQRIMAKDIIMDRQLHGEFADKARAIEIYEAHNASVRREIDPGRLLEMDISDGWEPLCRFLGKPVPDTPFPKANLQERFHKQFGNERPG